VGRRARTRGAAPSRHEARRRKAERRLNLTGISKSTLDVMNEEAERLFGLGVGVIVQEEERARRILASLGGRPGRFAMSRRASAARRAAGDVDLWSGRLRAVSEAVAAAVPDEAFEKMRRGTSAES
jgi:hypothetical protein